MAPVDNNGILKLAKARQPIPLINLTGVSAVPISLSCSSERPTVQVEEYTWGGSGLQNLCNGYYQWNWKTPTIYANFCKTFKLDLGEGTGFEHITVFKFKK